MTGLGLVSATSLLLADMAQRGEVALTDPVGMSLPAGVKGSLLGIALARRAGMDYEGLVEARDAGPLGMTSPK